MECVAIFKIFAAIWMNPYIQFGATNKKSLFSAYLFWMGELRILESAKYLIFIDIINTDCYIFFRSENIRFVTNTTCGVKQYQKEFQAR